MYLAEYGSPPVKSNAESAFRNGIKMRGVVCRMKRIKRLQKMED